MIIQKLATSLRGRDWLAVVIEVFIVVVGILIGLQVDDWNDARKDRLSEQHYLERIHDELGEDVEEFRTVIRTAEARRDMGVLLLAALDSPQLAASDPKAFFRAIEQANYTFSPTINDFSFEELKFDGNFGILRDAELRRALTSYYNDIENFAQWSYIREHYQLSYDDSELGILTLEQARKLMPYDENAEFTAEEALSALQRIAERPRFVEQIHRASNNDQVIITYYKWLGEAEKIRKRIAD